MSTGLALIFIGVFLAWVAFCVWMLVDFAKNEPGKPSEIDWLLAFLFVGSVGSPIYYFARKLPRDAAKRKLAEADEKRRLHETMHGLRHRENYDKSVPRTVWTQTMSKQARWAFGERQELLSDDAVFQYRRTWSGPFDVHGESGYALERNGKIIAEYQPG